jgi:outer membrane lipoprotein SlyB
MNPSLTRKAVVGSAALAAAGMLMTPASAAAQSYGYYGDRYSYPSARYDYRRPERYDSYDYCRSDRNQRTAAGATIGAGLGAVAGSQIAARGRRTEGSILGGVLGAVIGGSVGNDSGRDCDRYYDRSRYSDYEDRSYYGGGRYDDRYQYDRYAYDNRNRYGGYSYDDRYRYDTGYQYQDRYAYEQRGYDSRYSSYGYAASYGCRTVRYQTRDWNGRLITRVQEVCNDY